MQAVAAGLRPAVGHRGGVRDGRGQQEPAGAAREADEAGLAVAVLDICANVTMLLALHTWLLSLASILISLYPAATVVLAMIVLRERVTRWQGVGMVMAMGSVAMIAAS